MIKVDPCAEEKKQAAPLEAGHVMKNMLTRLIIGGAAAFTLIGSSFSGCDSTPPVGSAGTYGGNAGSVTVKLDGSPGTAGNQGGGTGTTGPAPTGDANCGNKTSSTKATPVDVLLVLDRSGSMTESIAEDCCCSANCTGSAKTCSNTASCTERWPALTAGVNATLSAAPTINWGLKFFATAGKSSCSVSNNVEVAIGSQNAAASIQTAISGTTPGSNTPTRAAVTNATAYLQTVKDDNTKVILLATDGEPNCNPDNGGGAATDLDGTKAAIAAAAAAGFKVYVIGIGPSVGNLDSFAQAGGTTKSYPATSADDLANALKAISKAVASCNFTMDQAAPDPNNVAVYLDTSLVPKDPANGWSWAPNSTTTVVLNGSACNQLTSGSAKTVRVLFGCKGEEPPPTLLF